jgi:hypothetical protein
MVPPCSRTASYFLARQLPIDFFDIQAFFFKDDLRGDESRGMFDESIALYEEMYTRICEEWACRSCVRRCLGLGSCCRLWWDLDRADWRWASVATDNLRSYGVTVILLSIGKKAVNWRVMLMAAIIRKIESEEHKATLYQERRGCWMTF